MNSITKCIEHALFIVLTTCQRESTRINELALDKITKCHRNYKDIYPISRKKFVIPVFLSEMRSKYLAREDFTCQTA